MKSQKDDRWLPFAAKEQACRGNPLRLQWRTFRGRYNGGAFTKQYDDVRHYRLVHSDLLDFAGLSSNLAI